MKNYFKDLQLIIDNEKDFFIHYSESGSVYIKKYHDFNKVVRISDHGGTDFHGVDIVNKNIRFLNKFQLHKALYLLGINDGKYYFELKKINERLQNYLDKKGIDFLDYCELKLKQIQLYSKNEFLKNEVNSFKNIIGNINPEECICNLYKKGQIIILKKYTKIIDYNE